MTNGNGRSGATGIIPEKYRKTRFTANCWYHLSYNPRLTFADYQRVGKDRECRESIFDQVKKDMELDRLFNRPEAVRPPEPAEAPPPIPPAPASAPPPPRTAVGAALAEGLAKAGTQAPRGPMTIERRAMAEEWIREHLDESWATFKRAHQEPELDRAWYDKIRKKHLEPKPEEPPMPTDTKARKGTSLDTVRVKKYLEGLSPDKLLELTHKKYMEKTGHKPPAYHYNNVRSRMLREANPKPSRGEKVKRGRKPAAGAATPLPAGSMQILAEIPLDKYGSIPTKTLCAIVLDVVKMIHPEGERLKVVILAEPPLLEIRL